MARSRRTKIPVEVKMRVVLAVLSAEATVQLRIWQHGAKQVDEVPSETSNP